MHPCRPFLSFQLLHELARRLNLQIIPVVSLSPVGQVNSGSYVRISGPELSAFGTSKLQRNGTWEGMLGYLANGTADTVCLFYTDTELRKEHFELSAEVYRVCQANYERNCR